MNRLRTRPVLALAAAALALLSLSCVDSPSAPDGGATVTDLILAPVLSLTGPDGAPATRAAQAEALDAAFQRVDGFRVQVQTQDGASILDTLVSVTPGQDAYDLQLPVRATAGEILTVTLTAFRGETELFRSAGIQVEATTGDGAAGPDAPTPAQIELSYSGPGATAADIRVAPERVVLSPGGSRTLTATLTDADGDPLTDVPISWSSTADAVASVDGAGRVEAGPGGKTEIVATSPNGIEARVWVYVARGTLAFVEGGALKTRGVAAGTASLQGGSNASGPSWSADGNLLFYSDAGSIRQAPRTSALMEGAWPSVSPDGTKLAVERDGRIWLANRDGTRELEGPAGSTPLWTGARELTVGGGSIDRVGVDGTGRTTVVAGDASLPAVGPAGGLAYVAGGELMVQGHGGPLASGVHGRPSWSPDGAWLAVGSDQGVLLVPSDGGGPALPLPGLEGAGDPAFRPQGALTAPPTLNLTGLAPDPPLPGQPVQLLGSGFDDVIPGNNRVFWPTTEGEVETEVTLATATTLGTEVPVAPAAGRIRVVGPRGESALDFAPVFGLLEIHAGTPSGTPVAGLSLTVSGPDGTIVADGLTGDDGRFVAPGLLPGRYGIAIEAPDGFRLRGATSRSVDVTTDASILEIELLPVPARVDATPSEPTLTLGQTLAVELSAFDVKGDPIPSFSEVEWHNVPAGRLRVQGTGLNGSIEARTPSARADDAVYSVVLNGARFHFLATVTTSISGTVRGSLARPEVGADGPAPSGALSGLSVELLDGDGDVVSRTNTDPRGAYSFSGLFQGSYQVRLILPEHARSSPETGFVPITEAQPAGHVDFTVSAIPEDGGDQGDGEVGGGRRPGAIVMVQDYQPWNNKDQAVLQSPPFNFTAGTDYRIEGTSTLLSPLSAGTSVVILSSLSSGGSPLTHVNSETAQANLEAWVREGGWLLVHAGDNVHGQGYMAPGLSGVADDALQCPGLTLAVEDHPFVRGPDGSLGTGDDLTNDNVDMESGCHVNHGSLSGILPDGALVLLVEEDGGRPTYATYPLGSGRVVITTQTIEFSGHSTRNIINHFWWTLMGGEAVPAEPMEPIEPYMPTLKARAGDQVPWSDGTMGPPGAH